eukprot:2168383-Ditylum_brightwellii.AAC.1
MPTCRASDFSFQQVGGIRVNPEEHFGCINSGVGIGVGTETAKSMQDCVVNGPTIEQEATYNLFEAIVTFSIQKG